MPVKAKYLSRSRENFQFKTDLGLKNIGGLAELGLKIQDLSSKDQVLFFVSTQFSKSR